MVWLVWGYLGQTPPGGPYTEGLRGTFVVILAVVIPLVSLIIVVAWVAASRATPALIPRALGVVIGLALIRGREGDQERLAEWRPDKL